MSELFNEDGTTPIDIENEDPHSDVPYLERLVGEGKKFKDVEALARSKFDTDMHAYRLEQENKKLREENATQKSLEDLIDQLRETNTPSNPVTTPEEQVSREAGAQQIKQEDIQSLVNKTLEQKQLETERARNVQSVEAELKKLWGPDFRPKLKAKVRELGVPEDFMASMAESHPQAFLKLINDGHSGSIDTNLTAPPVNRMIPSALQTNPNKAAEFYSNLRKTDPKKYWSPKVQDEIVKLYAEGKLKF